MSLRKHLILPSIVFALAVLAGCGSNNSVTTNNNGYSNSDLSGTYVFSFSGTDVNLSAQTQSFFAIMGTITADGSGHISGGSVDINDANIGGVFTGQSLTASTYSVGQDGRGTGTLVTPQGTFGLDFVLTSDNGGLISRFDSNGTGSGTFALQGSATQGSLTGLAFTLFGTDANFNFLGSVGAFTLNESGTIQAGGLEDFNDAGSGTDTQTLTGSLVLSSSTAGTAAFNTSFAPGLTFDVWVVDSTHLKLIETDTTGPALVGDAFPQASTFPAGQLVFSMAGGSLSSSNPIAAGGFVTTDANGNLSNGTEDYNNTGTANTVSNFSGSCNATAPFVGDRCELTTSLFTNGNEGNLVFAAYPSTAGVLLLEDDGSGFLQGAAYSQTATAFGAPEGYGLNLSGFNANGVADSEVDDIAEFNATSTNLTGVLDENDVASALITANLDGTYTPDSPATGRGSISATADGTFVGGLTLQYYVVGSSATVFIDVDTTQVATGVFELQSSPGSDVSKAVKPQEAQTAAAAQSIVSLVRPFGRAKLTPKHFNK